MTDTSNILTLTTDFSTEDGFVGAMKGRILSIAPHTNIQDISHHIRAQDILMASWCIYRSARHFPKGTVHMVVVDPGVGSDRHPILVEADEHWYVGPDNGVFSEIIRQAENYTVYQIHEESRYWKKHQTFDGFEVFCPVAAHLINKTPLSELGLKTDQVVMLPEAPLKKEDSFIEGEIIMFDQFGNAISNIPKKELEEFKGDRKVSCCDHTFKFVNHYKEGKENCPVALINSDQRVELSVYCGSSKDRFDLDIGDKIRIG